MLLGAIVVLFYLLRLRRQREIVPSVMLWQRAVEELEAQASFRKLRRSLLLLLQLLALAAIVLAMARPMLRTSSLAFGNTVIVIDSTASMSSSDEGGAPRLQRARQLARELVDGLSGDDRAAVIESSSRVTLRSAFTSDRSALHRAIDEIEPTDTAGGLTDAVRLAEQLARSEQSGSIVVIGDGGGPPLATDLISAGGSASAAAVRFVRVGTSSNNVGVIAFNARPGTQGRQQLFASVANFSAEPRSMTAELLMEGRLIDARSVDAPAGDRIALIFDSLPAAGGLAELKLDVHDDLQADNAAYCFVAGTRAIRVGVASGNPFVLGALAVNSQIDARRIENASSSAISAFDCLVAEGPAAATLAPSGRPMLLINPSDIEGVCRAAGQLERPVTGSVARAHPVNSLLGFPDLHVEMATRYEAASWLRPILSSAAGDGLIWAGESARRRMVIVGFDLGKSDLPLQVEFPILMANAVSWLSSREATSASRAIRAGQPAVISSSEPAATVTNPAGHTDEIRTAADGTLAYIDTMRAGIYSVAGSESFAASLVSESESDTAPRDRIKTRAGELTGEGATYSAENEIWRWVVAAALLVLTLEWWAFNRGIG
jgi:hypothetical protein